MQFVWWMTGVLATITAVRFVVLVFKRLTSKENMNYLLDRANDGLHNTADKVGNYLKDKNQKKKKKRTRSKKVDNRPIVTIR